MSKDNLVVDELPDPGSLMANWEDRIRMLEHEMSIQQGRMPKSKFRRVFWLIYNWFYMSAPIIGGVAAIFGEDPWKTTVILLVFLFMAQKSITDFSSKIAQGPRPHRSLLMKDHR